MCQEMLCSNGPLDCARFPANGAATERECELEDSQARSQPEVGPRRAVSPNRSGGVQGTVRPPNPPSRQGFTGVFLPLRELPTQRFLIAPHYAPPDLHSLPF